VRFYCPIFLEVTVLVFVSRFSRNELWHGWSCLYISDLLIICLPMVPTKVPKTAKSTSATRATARRIRCFKVRKGGMSRSQFFLGWLDDGVSEIGIFKNWKMPWPQSRGTMTSVKVDLNVDWRTCLVGGWARHPSEKWWSSSIGIIIPNIWKVIKFHGSKPPTRYFCCPQEDRKVILLPADLGW